MFSWSFNSIAPSLGIGAAIGSLVVLLALHFLRPQRKARTVATLIFFREAMKPSAARVLGGPFSRLFTFLLLLLLTSLIAAAIAIAPWRPDTVAAGMPAAIVVDAGCELTASTAQAGTPWNKLQSRCAAELMHLGSGNGPAVILAAAEPVLLSNIGTICAISRERLAHSTPSALPSSPSAALMLASSVCDGRPGKLIWYTTQNAVPNDIPPAVANRVVIQHEPLVPMASITDVLFLNAKGSRDHGHLLVRAGFSGIDGNHPPIATLDEDRSGSTPRSKAVDISHSDPSIGEVSFDNVVADGSTWFVKLQDVAGESPEQKVSIHLPRTVPPIFRFDAGVPDSLQRGLIAAMGSSADGEDSNRRVTVVHRSANLSSLPTASLSGSIVVIDDLPTAVEPQPLQADSRSMAAEGLSFEGATVSACTGLSEVSGSTRLLHAGSASMALLIPPIASPSIASDAKDGVLVLSSALFDQRSDFTRRAAFPIFLRTVCDGLVGNSSAGPSVVADRASADPVWTENQRATIVYQTPQVVAVSDTTLSKAPPSSAGWAIPPADLVLMIAAVALAVESILFATRKIV